MTSLVRSKALNANSSAVLLPSSRIARLPRMETYIQSHQQHCGTKGENMKKLRVFHLACKYWLSGDDWDEAVAYAKFIVNNFRRV